MADTISFESIRNGDIKAFETLFKEFYPSMCAIAIRFVSDKDVAQDIVQEVFIKLWEKRTSYEEIPNLKTFLYVSIKNLCFNYLRDKKETIDYTNQEVINREYHFKNRLIEEETIVRVEHLSHRYSIQWAIKDINFEIKKKGVLGLLGSNGAGKSTTMNIICGVLSQTAGEVYINGINTRENPVEAKKQIGFLPQKPPLYPDLTVDEYLTHCALMRLVNKHQVKKVVEEAKERCQIAHFSKRLIRSLSGGYQQRVGIAQAIVHKPQFVVLDEPTNGLDPNQIIEIRHLIKDIAKERAIMLSTHILSEVQATCNDIQMIEHGNVVFAGTINDLNNYIDPCTFLVSLEAAPPLEELKKIPGITQVEHITNTRFRMHFSSDQEITKQIINLSVANNWRLSEITLERDSLDTAFAQLSGKTFINKR